MMSNIKRIVLGFQALVVIGAIIAPQTAEASLLENLDLAVELPAINLVLDTDIAASEHAVVVTSNTYTSCTLTASTDHVAYNGSVTLTWDTEGFDTITVNGKTVTADDGSVTIDNIVVDSVYKLEATNANGDSCTTEVSVGCDPEPVVVRGCTDPSANNYESDATEDDDSCEYPNPVAPSCPLHAQDGRTIIDLGNKRIYSNPNRGFENTRSDVISANIPAGAYDITLVSWDGYTNRVNVSQPNERYEVQFTNGSDVIATTNAIGDLADNAIEATKTERVNQNLVLGTAATAVQAIHAAYPDKSSPNSLQPICIALDKEPEIVPAPTCDLFTATPNQITAGSDVVLLWETTNADQVLLNNNTVAVDGSTTVTPMTTTTYELTVIGAEDQVTDCEVTVEVMPPEVARCDLFTATPSQITAGTEVTLQWETTNVEKVFINNGVGEQGADGSFTVAPLASTTYELTLIDGDNQTVDCEVTVEVIEEVDEVPQCVAFTATPSALPVGGGDVTFAWEVLRADQVTITPLFGTVGLTGNETGTITESTTFVLEATDDNGDKVQCEAPVAVADPEVFTCADNVSFTASDNSIRRGNDVVLNWSTTNVDTVSISGINATDLSGAQTVSPSSDITYTLTATKGDQTISCPLSINVTTGGGGGGSSSPRCELEISDSSIKAGETITLTWDTSRTNDITITDDRGNVIVSTEDVLSSEKDDLLDGSIELTPTRDTEYTLVAERGSRDRECSVEVEVEDDIVVLQTRDQAPLVAGISLSSVPHTGFEAGPMMTTLFYTLLAAWALYLTYVLVVPKTAAVTVAGPSATEQMQAAEAVRPDVFAPLSVTQPVAASTATAVAPANLPVAPVAPTMPAVMTDTAGVEEAALEAIAHNNQALVSSDAMKTFLLSVPTAEQLTAIVEIVNAAKQQFPLEDGWVVVNNDRMLALLTA